LLLKSSFKLSDRGLVERTMTDMLFKYFLGYIPEDLEYCEENKIKNVSKLSSSVIHENGKNT